MRARGRSDPLRGLRSQRTGLGEPVLADNRGNNHHHPGVLRFFDTHAHIDAEVFDEDREEIIERALQAGLTDIVCIGASDGLKSNPRALELAERYDFIHATVGIHPHDAHLADEDALVEVRRMALHPKVVGIGETGLDYFYDHAPRTTQKAVFRTFVRLARELKKPCVVHTRDAEEDTLRILQDERAEECGGVLHCFTGTQWLADAAVELGFYISFSGILTFKNAQHLRDVAKNLPRNRVLVETDCPYLAPVPWRGKRNEPAYVVHTAGKLAEIWEEEPEEVRRITGDNAARFYGLRVVPGLLTAK